jgi:hypothetical protein
VFLKGTEYACGFAFVDFVIPPRDSLRQVFHLAAAEEWSSPSDVLPPGTYRIRTLMNADLPNLETEVTVTARGSD